jgi:heme oxygenase
MDVTFCEDPLRPACRHLAEIYSKHAIDWQSFTEALDAIVELVANETGT